MCPGGNLEHYVCPGGDLALGLAGGRENGGRYIASCFCPRWGAGAIQSHRRGKELTHMILQTLPLLQTQSLQRYQALPSIDLVTEKTTKITEAVTILRDAIRRDNLCRLPEVREMMLTASRDVASIFPQVHMCVIQCVQCIVTLCTLQCTHTHREFNHTLGKKYI